MIFLESHISKFLKFYRENFTQKAFSVRPHNLWIRTWKLVSGLMGEQGAESIHARIMKLERVHRNTKGRGQTKIHSQRANLELATSFTHFRPPLKKIGPYIKQNQ